MQKGQKGRVCTMKGNLLSDAQTAVGIFRDMRKARKAGQAIKFESTKSVQNKRMNENTETFNVKLCKIYYLISSSFSLLFDK